MGKQRKWDRGLLRWGAAALTGCLTATSCGTNLQDAVSNGLYQFVTQATVNLLNDALFPGSDLNGNGNGSGGDPFDDPPVQP